jgi:hypothetical protein
MANLLEMYALRAKLNPKILIEKYSRGKLPIPFIYALFYHNVHYTGGSEISITTDYEDLQLYTFGDYPAIDKAFDAFSSTLEDLNIFNTIDEVTEGVVQDRVEVHAKCI